MSDTLKFVFNEDKLPDLEEPYLICGLPGSGYVGKLAVEHIIQEVNAKLLADIYSPSFPPQVMIRSNGTAELMKNTIYYKKNDGKPDMLLLTGDGQPLTPEAEYTLGTEILELADKFHTKTVFTLAAYITGVFVDKPKVYTTATDEDLLKEFQNEQNSRNHNFNAFHRKHFTCSRRSTIYSKESYYWSRCPTIDWWFR